MTWHQADKNGCAAMLADGDLLYLAGNKGLAIFDITNPRAATRIANIDTGAIGMHSGGALVLNDDLLYVAGGKGLTVWDVKDRRKPLKTGTIDAGVLGLFGSVAAVKNGCILYLAGDKGLAAFSLDDPQKPSRIGDAIDTGALGFQGGAALCLDDEKTIMYVAGGKGLSVLDLQDPARPTRIGDVIDTGALALQGGAALSILPSIDGDVASKLYVGGGKGLAVFDISDKRSPVTVGSVYDTGCFSLSGSGAMALDRVEGTNVLMCAGGKGFGVFHVAGEPKRRGDILQT